MPELIPVTLLTGFLGSGKTTVLNHLVRQPEMADTLVIINEFGEMALDHMLVAHSTENLVMEMDSGCVCCTIRGDLVKTLRDMTWRFSRDGQQQFQRVLIETTGLADPAPIIHTLMTNPQVATKYRLDGILSTVDLATGMKTLDQYHEAIKQVAMADVLLLTKSDLVADEQSEVLINRLHELNPAAARWQVQNGQIEAKKLLDLGLFTATGKTADVARWLKEEAYSSASFRPVRLQQGVGQKPFMLKRQSAPASMDRHDVNRHNDRIHAFCFAIEEPIADETLAAWLEILMSFLGSKILRVKGIMNIESNPLPVVIHGVQHIFHPPVTLPAWPSEDRRSRLVFITHDVGKDVIEKTFHAFRQASATTKEVAA